MKSAFVTLLFVLLSTYSFAQPGDPGEDPDIPIDAGIGFLISAGAIFGAKKVYDFNKKGK